MIFQDHAHNSNIFQKIYNMLKLLHSLNWELPDGVHSITLPLNIRDGGNEHGKALPRVRAFVANTSYETSPLVIEERFHPGHVHSKGARLEELFFSANENITQTPPRGPAPCNLPLEEAQTQR